MQQNNFVVIIPAYEPSSNFIDYAKDLIKADIAQLVVVNDGSGEKYEPVFDGLRQLEKCTVISYEQNGGKGTALKTAFKFCKENYDERYTFITADCDGQHLIKDVLNVATMTVEFGDSFVLGVRDFSSDNVPKRSRLGNVSTRRAYRLLYGVKISDTQTGLRAFPYSLLDELIKIKGTRFEYEMNQLVVLHKHDIPIREVPIETVYEEKPEDVEKVSHYHTFRDSARVLKVLLTNLSWFVVASTIATIVELVLHYLGLRFFIPRDGLWYFSQAVVAQTIARLCSSIVQFTVNYKFVFNGHSKKSIIKYYILWLGMFLSSLAFAHWFRTIFEKPFWSVFMTGVSTLLMSLLSYQVQTCWVFNDGKRKGGKFWRLYARFVRVCYRIITPKYTSLVAHDPRGVVYVCRHLNMHGPYVTAGKLGFDVHMMGFSIFFKWKECFRHLRDYNCKTVLKMKAFPANICAFFLATAVCPLLKSMEAIPVYRNDTQALTTFRKSLACLERHESLIVYPDITYTADAQTDTDIYSGFLFLEKMYYKRTGKHLMFVPLVINDEARTITEKAPIRFKNGDFKSQIPEVKTKIMKAIGSLHEDGENE